MTPLSSAAESKTPIQGELASLLEAVAGGRKLDAAERIALLQALLGENTCRRLGIYPLPKNFLLSVVIPLYNEVGTIEEVVRRVRQSEVPCEIILVDDGSDDGVGELIASWEAPDLRVFRHEKNQGKGAALKTGFAHARGDVVIVQDADLEYDPVDYLHLLQPIIEGQADVVYGSRFSSDRQRVLYFRHFLGNRLLTTFSNWFTNLNLSDMETGYKVFRREIIEQVAPTLREKRFGVEPEITAKVAKLPGVRVFERPISYSGRTYAEGKKIGWRDGLCAFWCILKYRRGI